MGTRDTIICIRFSDEDVSQVSRALRLNGEHNRSRYIRDSVLDRARFDISDEGNRTGAMMSELAGHSEQTKRALQNFNLERARNIGASNEHISALEQTARGLIKCVERLLSMHPRR